MVPYFLLVGIPILLCLISNKYRITLKGRILIETQTASIDVFMLFFLLLLAFRSVRCGSDTKQYLRVFGECATISYADIFANYDYEYGYKILNKLVSSLGGDFQMLLTVSALISVVPLWCFYKKESENQVLTIALFVAVAPFMMYFSGIRQAITMALGIPAWYAARAKKPVRFLIWVFFAIQFHNSAFMLLAIYPLYHARITTNWLWFVVPCMLVIYAFRTAIFGFLLTLLWEEYDTTPETGATTVLLLLILFGVYSFVIVDEKSLDKDTIALRNFLLLSIVIQIFALLHPLSMRMNYYYLIFIPVLIPKIANRSKIQFAQIAKLSTVVMTVYFLYYFINKVVSDIDSLNIFPYIPFWRN